MHRRVHESRRPIISFCMLSLSSSCMSIVESLSPASLIPARLPISPDPVLINSTQAAWQWPVGCHQPVNLILHTLFWLFNFRPNWDDLWRSFRAPPWPWDVLVSTLSLAELIVTSIFFFLNENWSSLCSRVGFACSLTVETRCLNKNEQRHHCWELPPSEPNDKNERLSFGWQIYWDYKARYSIVS